MYQELQKNIESQIEFVRSVFLVHQKYLHTMIPMNLRRRGYVRISTNSIKIYSYFRMFDFKIDDFEEYKEVISDYNTMSFSQFILSHGKNPFKILKDISLDELSHLIINVRSYL